jgi:hypothetical protein
MRHLVAVGAVALLTGCTPPSSRPTYNRSASPAAASGKHDAQGPDVPASAVTAPAPGRPGGLEDDRSPLPEAASSETSAQGAANVVQTYYALLEERKYGEARRLWGEGGANGADAETFERSFSLYPEYHAQAGKPGRIEGAAGSLFVSVPVQLYGRGVSGKAFSRLATVTLRRVNDVPGAKPEQLRWHIERVSPAPPHG